MKTFPTLKNKLSYYYLLVFKKVKKLLIVQLSSEWDCWNHSWTVIGLHKTFVVRFMCTFKTMWCCFNASKSRWNSLPATNVDIWHRRRIGCSAVSSIKEIIHIPLRRPCCSYCSRDLSMGSLSWENGPEEVSFGQDFLQKVRVTATI